MTFFTRITFHKALGICALQPLRLAVCAILLPSLALAGDKPIPQTFESLDSEFLTRLNLLRKSVTKDSPPADRQKAARGQSDLRLEFAHRFFVFADQAPTDPQALDALRAAIVLGKGSADSKQAFARIRRDWVVHPRAGEICQIVGQSPFADAEDFLREVIAKNSDKTPLGLAKLALADLQTFYSKIPGERSRNPASIERIKSVFGESWLAEQTAGRASQREFEAVKLYEDVAANYADVPLHPELKGKVTKIGPIAQSNLKSLLEVVPGRVAPGIDAKDLDGQPVRLRDLRGRVVLLVFWASWCAPCRAEFPAEKELVKKYTDAGKPFTLLGVNADRTLKEAQDIAAQEQLPWKSCFDGPVGDDQRTIRDRFGVNQLPAVFVIDDQGIIRYKDINGEELKNSIDVLLKTVK